MKKVAIVGGGLAGLISGIELSKKGVPCTLFEKKKFPFHRVCGEYISNEALPYLEKNGLYPSSFNPAKIHRLVLSSVSGQIATMPLDLGGFGISRFTFDNFLAGKAVEAGVDLREDFEVSNIAFENDRFQLVTGQRIEEADVVIGAFGKRSKLDVALERKFIRKRSPYVGVKYHVKSSHPDGLISLHNFNGGYCGIVNIENERTNLCYLVERHLLQRYRSVAALEENELSRNPQLRPYFNALDRENNPPIVINEVSFATKSTIENHVLMAGDAAGMITPLCGNGMAIAIQAGRVLSDIVADYCAGKIPRNAMEAGYDRQWRKLFHARLKVGRAVQHLFGAPLVSTISVGLVRHIKPLAAFIVKNTHGKAFY